MPTISPEQSSPGEEITAAKINNPVNTIADLVNGNLDSDNIASLSGAKLTSATVPGTALDSTARGGWITGLTVPTGITYNGNRSYSLTYAASILGYKSVGMRSRFTRTVTAPTQCTDLESSSSQYWSKSSPTGLAQTDDITCMAWIKLESYTGSSQTIMSRINGTTDGWTFEVNSSGQLVLKGARAADDSVTSYQSVPLGRWVHVAASLDSSGAAGVTYMDGIAVPSTYTNNANSAINTPTADFRIGAGTGGTLFLDGKIAQAALFDAVLTAATIRSYASQTLSGSETNCIGAWTFNGNGNDSDANANNLTAQGSATATTTDSPFAGGSSQQSYTAGTTEFAITTLISSDGLTETVQVPEGYALPTSGGVSALAYSAWKVPLGFPSQKTKWTSVAVWKVQTATAINTTTANLTGLSISLPVGAWDLKIQGWIQTTSGGTTNLLAVVGLSSTSGAFSGDLQSAVGATASISSSVTEVDGFVNASQAYDVSGATTIYGVATTVANQNVYYGTTRGVMTIQAECAYV